MSKTLNDISVYKDVVDSYNIYAVECLTDDECQDITLNEDTCVLKDVGNFDFAIGFASAILCYASVTDVFVTEVHIINNMYEEDKDPEVIEKIIWSGTVNSTDVEYSVTDESVRDITTHMEDPTIPA